MTTPRVKDGNPYEQGTAEHDAYSFGVLKVRCQRMEDALRSLLTLTRFELADNKAKEPWKRVLAKADAALSQASEEPI